MSTNYRGTGTVIKDLLSAWGITSHAGCGCNNLAAAMDNAGPDEVERNIEEYTQKMSDSVKEWRLGTGFPIPQPPRFIIAYLIQYAIGKSREVPPS